MNRFWIKIRSLLGGGPAFPAHLFIALYLFLFLPALLFIQSRNFWNYGFDALFLILFPCALVAYGLLSLLIIWIKPSWLKVYTAFITGMAFALWVSAWFVGSKGVDDGQTFELVTTPIVFYGSLLTTMVVGLLAGCVSYYRTKITNTMLMLGNIACAVLVLGYVGTDHKSGFLDYEASQQALTTFSKDRNVLVLLLDSFQSDFLESILKNNPTWMREMQGFTFYVNAASTAPGTVLSLPTIHSGHVYHAGEVLDKFYESNVEKKSFMNAFEARGYDAMILNPYFGYSPGHAARVNQNYLSCRRVGALCEAQQLISYALFNAVPHGFKKYIYNEGFWLLPAYFPASGIVSNQVLSELASNLQTNALRPTIKFLHLYGAHAPAILDQSCHPTHAAVWSRAAAIQQAQCTMGLVLDVLSALKKQDIYQQTAILIIADHGSGLPLNDRETILGASANPLFLFKPWNATDHFQSSEALVSLMDVPELMRVMSRDSEYQRQPSHELVDSLTERQSVPFNYYQLDKDQNVIQVYPYEIHGTPRNSLSWRKIPPKAYVTQIALTSTSFLNYAGEGWGQSEIRSGVRWSVGKEAFLSLSLKPHQNSQIVFNATTHRFNPNQILAVWVNQTLIGKYKIPVGAYRRIVLNVPKEIITETPTQVRFQFSECHDAPGDANNYPLAVAFYGFLYIT